MVPVHGSEVLGLPAESKNLDPPTLQRQGRPQGHTRTDPDQQRWVVEWTNSWMNGFGKIRRYTGRNALIINFYLYLPAAIVTIRQLIQRARTLHRWDPRQSDALRLWV
ncbi:hypothetical protein [Actinoplanes sp. NPDC049802]|uniref:hypothetical protein n=1 Tax=Actinoplanes sp. NPDC049802 TaxID=3154742 RepID=UPI0033E6BB7F